MVVTPTGTDPSNATRRPNSCAATLRRGGGGLFIAREEHVLATVATTEGSRPTERRPLGHNRQMPTARRPGSRPGTPGPGPSRPTTPRRAPSRPRPPLIRGLVLAPGASAGRDHEGLVAIEDAVQPLGIAVERVDFPYHRAGRRAPDRPPVLMATVRDAATELAARLQVPEAAIALGGRSMGGRIGSMVAAEGHPVAALVLVSYPLHPPGRPDRARVEHFPDLRMPCLFVSGTRDAFGTPEELEAATASIPGPVTHVWIEGADHGMRRRHHDAAAAVRTWLSH